jgi:hypothetical protein
LEVQQVTTSAGEIEQCDDVTAEVVTRYQTGVELREPLLNIPGADVSDVHLEVLGQPPEPQGRIIDVSFAQSIGLFRNEELFHDFRDGAGKLGPDPNCGGRIRLPG